MTAIEQIRARKAEAQAAYARAIEARKAAEAAESAARDAWIAARYDAEDAELWLSLPKAARKRARSAPELVAAFAAARAYGAAEAEWVERKWRKSAWRREHFGSGTVYTDTPTGTAARILHRRGREWCDALEVSDG